MPPLEIPGAETIATLSQAPDTNTGYYENGCPGGPLRRRVLRRPGVPLGGRVPLSPGGAAAPPSRGTPPAEVLRRPGVPPGAPSGGGSSGVRGSLYRPPAQIPRRAFQARMPPLTKIGVDLGCAFENVAEHLARPYRLGRVFLGARKYSAEFRGRPPNSATSFFRRACRPLKMSAWILARPQKLD